MAAGNLILKRRNENDNGTHEFEVPFAALQTLASDVNNRPVANSVASQQAALQESTDDEAPGFKGIPVVTFIAATAVAAAHIGKCLLHLASDANARTVTIPDNEVTALPVGFKCDVHNQTAELVTIAITTDTLTLVAAGTTGSLELEQDGRVTLHKITATDWVAYGWGVAAA
jgi:hypothetical protein